MVTNVDSAELERLNSLSRAVRERVLSIVYESGSGHVGAALSQVDILVSLYARVLNLTPRNWQAPERDRFVLSKGHGGLGFAAVLVECGFLSESEIASFGRSGSPLGMHLDRQRVAGVEQSTGSLGHGLGVAVGMALGARLLQLKCRVVCLLSDGECYEGSIWEAAQSATSHRLSRLTAIVDRNRLTMDGFTEDEAPLEPLAEKWQSFGFRVLRCDGHDHAALLSALSTPPDESRPSVLLADTVKGRGVDFMENQAKWHYGALDSHDYARALESLRRRP
ncbi:MAG: transketolase [Polyangiaceae bacterium]